MKKCINCANYGLQTNVCYAGHLLDLYFPNGCYDYEPIEEETKKSEE